jgi:CRP/FNR family cyclic AMP-dependent transcriptional regulator
VTGQPRPVSWAPTSLLGTLPDTERAALLALGTQMQYPAEGHVLIKENDDSTFVVVILDGVVKVTGLAENGSEAFLAVRVSGELVGEFAAVDQRRRTATVTTGGPVVARTIPGTEFLGLLRRRPELSVAVMRSVVDKTRAATSRRIDFKSCDAGTRLARIMLELATRHGRRTARGVEIGFTLTQPELANLASTSEPNVQRILRKLRERHIIGKGYRELIITDLAGLASEADLSRPPEPGA